MKRLVFLGAVLACLSSAPMAAGGAEAVDPYPDAPAVAKALGISEAEARSQAAERPSLGPAIVYVKSHPEEFGGVYLDADAVLTIGLPDGRSDGKQAVEAILPLGVPARWISVAHSQAELSAVRDALLQRIPEFNSGAAPFASLSISASRNVVELVLDGPVDAARSALSEEFDGIVEVTSGPRATPAVCTRNSCTPWRGGLKITGPATCTYGFNTRKVDGTAVRMMTAGHCNSGTWYQNTNGLIGTTGLSKYYMTNHWMGDFQRVPTSFTGAKNLLYVNDSMKGRALTGQQSNNEQIEGDIACYSGISTDYHCSGIVMDDVTYTLGNDNISLWGKAFNYVICCGDSGGPVFHNYSAMGINSGSNPAGNYSFYATVENAVYALNVFVCRDFDCVT